MIGRNTKVLEELFMEAYRLHQEARKMIFEQLLLYGVVNLVCVFFCVQTIIVEGANLKIYALEDGYDWVVASRYCFIIFICML
jgi:hypothetical protein